MAPKHPQLRFFRVPALDLELLHTRELTHDYPPHLHEETSIGVVFGGREVLKFGTGTHSAVAGSVLLINAEDVHANESFAVEYCVMKVRPAVLREIAGGTVRFPSPVVNDRRSFSALAALFRLFDEPASLLEVQSAFTATIAALLIDHPQLGARGQVRHERRAVTAVREHLKEHFANDVSLAQLTAIAGLSPFHLLRKFREHAGVPPHRYQTQLRIAHARRLIRAGKPIADAALEAGFCDQSHLDRSFKRIVGMTPRQYIARSKIVQDRAARG